MRKLLLLTLLAVVVLLVAAPVATADPRMETNDNFCHFILDPVNTDNEIFVAGCNSSITVVEKNPDEPAKYMVRGGDERAACEEHDRYMARGYAKVVRRMPAAVAPLAAGEKLMLTSEDSEIPCTMVESNGRQYKSHRWVSRIKVVPLENGRVKVVHELFCEFDE